MNNNEYVTREFIPVNTKIDDNLYADYVTSTDSSQLSTNINGSLLLAKQMIEIDAYHSRGY